MQELSLTDEEVEELDAMSRNQGTVAMVRSANGATFTAGIPGIRELPLG